MSSYIVLRIISIILIPFLILFAIYVQMHGEYSPGGGFQAGVILAATAILLAQVHGLRQTQEWLPVSLVKACACIGVLIFGGTGVVSLIQNTNFLNYNAFNESATTGQTLGIIIVELGVGLSVFASMLLLYYLFAGRKE